ncbi:toll/interleukin-1 receptor domain-containing protein [Nitrosomonas sp.]|uniref:toll/interleukin-1 receptor domain-containing protein n=1 Tax=Nitrosomonas sp. TaxID=42353 RepID=UPI00374CF930
MNQMQVFISHDSKDVEIVSILVDILRSSLNIPPKQIRCTSLDGFRLPIGTLITDRIKKEVCESKVLIALITPNSLESQYFMFELGARWGANLPLLPLFAGGTNIDDVSQLLRDFNILQCSSENQVIQMVNDLGEHLERIPEGANCYLNQVKKLVAASKCVETEYIESLGQIDDYKQVGFQAQMKEEDEEIGQEYSDFFRIAHRFYVDFFRSRGDIDFPDKLEGLIRAAGTPPHITEVELISWSSLYEDGLNQDQRRMWNFVKKIYPARVC